jgi:Domain of unknown function (DUF4263)
MAEVINTRHLSDGYTDCRPVILEEEEGASTRVLFLPGISRGGVKGRIIRQKKGSLGTWEKATEVDFRHVEAGAAFGIDLSSRATRRLADEIEKLEQVRHKDPGQGRQSYLVIPESEALVITDKNKAEVFKNLRDAGFSEEFWASLTEGEPCLAAQLAAAQIHGQRIAAIREYEASLASHPEDESHWQALFKREPWMLASVFSAPLLYLDDEVYLGGKTSVGGRQGSGGVATDFVFKDESTLSFAVAEIKTPKTPLVGGQYRGDRKHISAMNRVNVMHGDLTGALVQTRNQIAVAIEDFRSCLGKEYRDLNRLHPSGIIVIGSRGNLDEREWTSFNLFRHSLHGVTVITFDELLKRLRFLFLEDD